MRVIVCGGRNYDDWGRLERVLDTLDQERGPFMEIMVGGASGADDLAVRWGHLRQRKVLVFPAAWKEKGRGAGPLRNQKMIDSGARLVIAFPGHRGTADCVRRARKAYIPVVEVQ